MAKQKFTPLPQLNTKDISRFHGYVDKRGPDECWPWIGPKDAGGYGHFVKQVGHYKSHRVAYFIATGTDPGELRVLHSCDFPACNNPSHLSLGDQTLNMAGACERNRIARGERSSNCKLTNEQVLEIRRRYKEGEGRPKLSKEFSVSYPAIFYITKGTAWPHI